jgi:hypothetical protein
MIFSGVMLVFRDLDPRMPKDLVAVLRRKGEGPEEQATID